MPDRESSPSVVVPRMPTREGPQEGGSVCAATLAEAAAIDLDLERTFSHLSSAASGREEAKILLNRFVEEHPDVGYTQGMNYVATCLVLRHTRGGHCAREVAYQQFVAIMAHLSGLWSDGLPLLQPAISCYVKCCKKYLPRLHARLAYLHVEPLAYLPTGWLSLFSKWLPMDSILLVLDLVAGHGLNALLAVTLSIFHQYQDVITQMQSMHQVLNFINRDMQLQPVEADKLISSTTMVWLPRVHMTVGKEVQAAVENCCELPVQQGSSPRDELIDDGENSTNVDEPTAEGTSSDPPGPRESNSMDSCEKSRSRSAPSDGTGGPCRPSSTNSNEVCDTTVRLESLNTSSDDKPCEINPSDSAEEIQRLKSQLAERDATIEALRAEMENLRQERMDAIEMQMKCVRAKDELQRQLLGEIADLRYRLDNSL